MLTRIGAWFRHARATWFPERELYIRCNGVVRYWVIARRVQWTVACAAAGAGLWVLLSTSLLLVDWLMVDEPGRIAAAVDAVQRDMVARGERLRQRIATLEEQRLSDQDRVNAARQTISSLRVENETLRQAEARLTRERAVARGRAERLARQLDDSGAALEALRARSTEDLDGLRDRLKQMVRARESVELQLREARAALNTSEATRAGGDARLASVKAAQRALIAELRNAEARALARANAAVNRHDDLAEQLRQARAAAATAEATAQQALARAAEGDRRAAAANARLAAARERADALDSELDGLHRRLRTLLADRNGDDVAMQALAANLAGTLTSPRPQLDVAGLTSKLAALPDLPDQRRDAERVVALELVGLADAKRASEAARRSLDTTTRSVADRAAATSYLLDRLSRERRAASRRDGYYIGRITALEQRMEALREQQAVLIGELEDRAIATIDGLEDTVYATGLDLDELMRRMDDERGIGGPFIGLPDPSRNSSGFATDDAGAALSAPLDRLYGRLARWKALNLALERVPLTPPVDNFYVSSNFGKRRDPYTGRWAMHAGVDMAGPRNAEIYATAPGVVTHAGWMGQYGTMVEIDHGFGLTTRYGHLSKLLVKKGQTVAFRDRIGIMGSTGRSTSRHVHYEVRFDGEPVDPAKFIEAGRNVFKN
jgi:murein DD-endopeptidase MepM/ murein hydrolase activator NlpD